MRKLCIVFATVFALFNCCAVGALAKTSAPNVPQALLAEEQISFEEYLEDYFKNYSDVYGSNDSDSNTYAGNDFEEYNSDLDLEEMPESVTTASMVLVFYLLFYLFVLVGCLVAMAIVLVVRLSHERREILAQQNLYRV